ncbi:MAG: hypothetical protein E6R03_07740 [Hyphomicrobiaceae bacterium]|nr:MAG: hypothetical protein E6R03_07740 [Hyphomicrobiaceae bacterium]
MRDVDLLHIASMYVMPRRGTVITSIVWSTTHIELVATAKAGFYEVWCSPPIQPKRCIGTLDVYTMAIKRDE